MTNKASEALVLAVDDEVGILKLIRLELMAQGFRVITASNGEEAIKLADEQRPDIMLLDVRMPDMTGMEVMKALREHSSIPIILVTAKDKEIDKVAGLELGADDYIVKPFSPDELAARIRAVLRRSEGAHVANRVIHVGKIEVDLDKRLVKRNNEIVSLTRNEWLLLQQLAINSGKVMLNAELLSKVWGPEYRDDVQYLRVWVSRLRHKLEEDPAEPKIIKTAQGIGYMMSAEEEETKAVEAESNQPV